MKKTLEIDFSANRIVSVAADMVDGKNYVGALKMLNKNAEINGNDEDTYMLYAEAFDDMGLYEKSVNNWFKFLDTVEFGEPCDCYEGLAVDYMNLGMEHFSAFYYNKLLSESGDLDPESRERIVNDFLSAEENPLKFVYPPEIADCSDIMAEGVNLMKQGKFVEAAAEFAKVGEGNEKYPSARNYIAMCNIIADKNEEAEEECLRLLEKYPDNIESLTTLAAVKTDAGKTDEAKKLAERLLSLNPTDPDKIYKIATVCCENKMHSEAYGLFCKLSDELANDLSVMYFKAVSAFNCGKFEESFQCFDRLLTVFPEAVTAKYFYDRARALSAEPDNGEEKELSYFYRLPPEIREASLKMLAACARLTPAAARKLSAEVDLRDCILWCFDETDGKNAQDLQRLASHVAVLAGLDDIVRDILLNAFVSDEVKIDILTSLAERNKKNSFGAVICHIYKSVETRRLRLGRAGKSNFLQAYARLFSHFGILDDDNGEAFASAAESIYQKLEEAEKLSLASDVDALCAAMFIYSGVTNTGLTKNTLNTFFEVSKERIDKILAHV